MKSVFAIAWLDKDFCLKISFVRSDSELGAAQKWSDNELGSISIVSDVPIFATLKDFVEFYSDWSVMIAEVPTHV